MKIILCTFLLCITAVSVFGKPQELNGVKEKNIEFPAEVKNRGFLIHGVTIGDSSSETSGIGKYSSRVQWDSSTGHFSLSGLTMEDIGEYKVQNTDTNITTVFQLNVYIPVSKPHVSITQNEYPCTIECTAESGTGVTLSWYREGQKKPYGSSPVRSAPDLYLPQTVHKGGIYTCEANNSVSNEKASITVGDHCTVSVFGELNGILGQSVKFPAAVKKGGFLMYSGDTIGDSSRETPGNGNEKYRDRLDWDSSTGFFSLSGLREEDSGEYKVQNTDQNIAVFQLNVYKDNVPVSKPHVSITQNEYPCTLLCAVERGTGVTLSWYREGEKKPYVTSPVESAPGLHLPVPVESGTYTCEAKNSVSNEKASITVGAHCTAPSNPIMWILIAVVVLLLLLAIVAYCLRRRILRFIRRFRGETILELSPDAVRTLIQVNKLLENVDPQAYDRRTLIQVKNLIDDVDPRAYGSNPPSGSNGENDFFT